MINFGICYFESVINFSFFHNCLQTFQLLHKLQLQDINMENGKKKNMLVTNREFVIHPDHGNITVRFDPKSVIFTGSMYPNVVKGILHNVETPEQRAIALAKSIYPPVKSMSDIFGKIMGQVRVHNEEGDGDGENSKVDFELDSRNVLFFVLVLVFFKL